MNDPAYSFTIPSVHDDLPLDCRIHHPPDLKLSINSPPDSQQQQPRAAIVAHAYAPLGGSYDDPVVHAVTRTLLDQGYIVATFNFRGAGDSAGKTSWTGNPEVDDYASVVGLVYHYARSLHDDPGPLLPSDALALALAPAITPAPTLHLLLAGYSFGSLILARLPPVATILHRFASAGPSEILLRARTLRTQTLTQLHDPDPPPPVILGGAELPAAAAAPRNRSRDVPHHIVRTHVRRRSGHSPGGGGGGGERRDADWAVATRYVLVSPVLLPMTTTLLWPGLPFPSGAGAGDVGLLAAGGAPVLVVFGSRDSFTASRRLRLWAEKLASASEAGSSVVWEQIEGVGHFWREVGARRALDAVLGRWIEKTSRLG